MLCSHAPRHQTLSAGRPRPERVRRNGYDVHKNMSRVRTAPNSRLETLQRGISALYGGIFRCNGELWIFVAGTVQVCERTPSVTGNRLGNSQLEMLERGIFTHLPVPNTMQLYSDATQCNGFPVQCSNFPTLCALESGSRASTWRFTALATKPDQMTERGAMETTDV